MIIKIKNCIFFLIFIFVLKSGYGQSKINHVEYNIFIGENAKDIPASVFDNLISDSNSKLKQVSFTLNFDNNNAKFSLNDNLLSHEDNLSVLDFTDMKIGTEIYTKSNCDTIFTKIQRYEVLKNNVSYTINKANWFITLEHKVINGFYCQKAIGTIIKDYGEGEHHKVDGYIAWFCPDIKSSFGPNGFMGLPGLILELEMPIVTLTAKIINHSSTPIILSPQTKNLVSEDHLRDLQFGR